MSTLSDLDKRISTIEHRNIKVEIDKAWEGSLTRKFLVIIFTYLSISLYLYFIVGIDSWITAVIPSLGF